MGLLGGFLNFGNWSAGDWATAMMELALPSYFHITFGILVALLLVVLAFAGISVAQRGKKNFTVLSYVVALVMMVPLSFQGERLVGAAGLWDFAEEPGGIDKLCVAVQELRRENGADDSLEKTKTVLRKGSKTLENMGVAPGGTADMVDDIGNLVEEGRNMVEQLVVGKSDIRQALESRLLWYAVRRVLWCLLFLVIGIAGVVVTMEPVFQQSTVRRESYHDDF